jgi:biopolymer transport protein ExbD
MPKLEPMANSVGRSGHRRARAARVSSSLAEINIVPLVDVMLVLLVIFMVAAPMMQQGFPVSLPRSSQSRPVTAPVTVTIPPSFRKDQRVQIGDEYIRWELLVERTKQALAGKNTKKVIVAGDGTITMNDLFMVFDKLKEGGVEDVGLQSQPAAETQ